jgi:hypothetical protein
VQELPSTYADARPATCAQVQAACSELQPEAAELPFAALVLLDQAAAAGLGQPQQAPQDEDSSEREHPATANGHSSAVDAALVAAAVLVASQALAAEPRATSPTPAVAAAATAAATSDGAPEQQAAALSEAAVAVKMGVTRAALQEAAAQLREACPAACARPVTALQFVELFTAALTAGCLEYQVPATTLVGDVQSLARTALPQASARDLSARDLAAALIVAGRRSNGLFPLWPKCLVVVTGALNPLGMASVAQLLQQLQRGGANRVDTSSAAAG